MQPPKGGKEVERIIHQGCQQNLPPLNPKAGIPAIQLVGPETSKEELHKLYLEVYKLHRLPGSPPGEPVLLEEVLSSLEDHQGQKGEKTSAAMMRSHPEDPHSSRSGTPQKGKKDSLVERSLAMVHEAHQKALAMVATLEEEIERLSHTQNCSEMRVRSKSRDCQGQGREEQKRRHCQVWFEDLPAPNCPTGPKTGSSEEEATGKRSDLEEPPELGPAVASFLRGSPETSEDEGDRMPPEPAVLEFSQWLPWKAKKCKTPHWWTELLTVPGMEDCRKACQGSASLLPAPTADVGIRNEGGQPPGSSGAAMPL